MHKDAHPTPSTIICEAITWTKFDMRLAGASEPGFEYCADGEGLFVVKEEKEGFVLYQEGLMMKVLGADAKEAIADATAHMKQVNPTLYRDLGGQRDGSLPEAP